MTTKSYSKHKEYKEFSNSGNVPYTDEQFDMLKSELIPKNSKLDSLGRSGTGTREYHYEYKEEKHPTGKYDRKDLHTVEEYTIPPKSLPKSTESSAYYYTREERELPSITSSNRSYVREDRDLPSITSGTRTYNYETTTSTTPGYSKVKSSKVTKDLSQNVEELDSLLDDLQKDQERQLYKSGYTSDTAESSSFDYKRGTPAKAPASSGYSTMKREERLETSSWGSSPPPMPTSRTAEMRQEMYREEKTESRVVPAQPPAALVVPSAVCTHCHQIPNSGTLPRGVPGAPMNKVTTTVKTYTYEVPAGQDPTTVPLPPLADHQHTYVSSTENLRSSTSSPPAVPPSPGGCQHCSHCNSRLKEYNRTHITTADERTSERVVYPSPSNQTHTVLPAAPAHPVEPLNGHGPYGPTTYKYSETSYSSQNTSERFPVNSSPRPLPSPHPVHHLTPAHSPGPSPAPFPRSTTPSPGHQQPPKQLDELLADFPEARFPTQPDGVVRRKVEVHESSRLEQQSNKEGGARTGPLVSSKNVAGPAVYYPPGHTPFAKKEGGGYEASAMQGGGAYASGRGMYEYESGARSKEKHTERKTAVPICLPLCCAMPCVIM